jgi:hypothetical protein
MSQLVFQANAGGAITLTGTNTASNFNLTVPAANGTILYQDTSGNITFTNVIVTGNLSITGTSAFGLPVGNTVQRPASPSAGNIRYNTDGGGLYEVYLPALTSWQKVVTQVEGSYQINYLVVGGGGGSNGSTTFDAGGGGGQVTQSVLTAIPSTVFTITIGGGGANGAAGSSTTISGIATAVGGGTGTHSATPDPNGWSNGGTSGNGYAGGTGVNGLGVGLSAGGGGGGASAAGGAGNTGGAGGAGGAGAASTITGSSVTYGGGGGGSGQGSGGSGGAGGGGAGGVGSSGSTQGTVNSGGGGGANGRSGGSGVAVLSMAASSYTGTITGSPTVVNTGTTVILTYTSSGTYTA